MISELLHLFIRTAQAQAITFDFHVLPAANRCWGVAQPDFLPCYFNTLYEFAVQAAIAFAVMMIAIGGFQWLAAIGNPGKISNAKATISGAIIGLLLALTAYVILSQINANLVNLSLPYVDVIKLDPLDSAGTRGSVIDICTGQEENVCKDRFKGICKWDGQCKPDYFSYGARDNIFLKFYNQQTCCILVQESKNKVVSHELLFMSPNFPAEQIDAVCQLYLDQTVGSWKKEGTALDKGSCSKEYLEFKFDASQSTPRLYGTFIGG